MTQLYDVFKNATPRAVQDMIDTGYVSQRFHPEFPELAILNYTEKTAYSGEWNEVTLNSRGLIYNTDTLEVLARPFKKFFNFEQVGAPEIDLDAELFFVSDKFDGSLGIIYRTPIDDLAVATRGSFESEQAKHATEWIRGQEAVYDRAYELIAEGLTPLVEIIYPENRIVVDYGGKDYLQYLGAVNTTTGEYVPPAN